MISMNNPWMKKLTLLLIAMFSVVVSVTAQENNITETLTTQNKLMSVNVVLMLILVGILIYIVIQDKKIKKLEDRIND